MSISVGSVSVDIVPDTRKFAADLKAKVKGVSATVAVDADTAGLREKIKQSTKTEPVKVKITPDSDAFAAKVKADAAAIAKAVNLDVPLTADGERLRRSVASQVQTINALAKVEIPVDLEKAAALRTKMAVELDILKAMAREAHPTVSLDADTAAATAKIDAAARDRKAKIDISAAGTGLTAILALGPALVPITAAVAGLGAAFALPVAAAGGGLTLGGIVAGAAIKQTETQKKKIDELAKKVAAAKQNLANVQASSAGSAAISTAAAQAAAQRQIDAAQAALNGAKTPAAAAAAERRLAAARASLATSLATTQARSSLRVADAQRKVTETTAAYDAALKGLTPAQQRFLKSQQAVKDSFKGLVRSAGPAIFGPLVTGMDALSKIMPTLKGPLTSVSRAVGTLLGDIVKSTSSPGFKNFMNAFGTSAASAIVTFGRAFGNFTKGTFGLLKSFSPLSKDALGGLSDVAKRFAEWGSTVGQTKGFQFFLAYLRDTGPKVAATLGSVVKALVRVGVALAPIGALALGGIKVLADVIRVIPVPVLTATAAGIIAVVVALKTAQIINSGSEALGKLSTAINGFRGADAQLSKTSIAIRGLAGTAGLGLLTASATSSNKALGILGSAGGGALLGFAVGGPVGAAIGAGAGALFGLATQVDNVDHTISANMPTIKTYAATLDDLSGAATRATRELVYQRLAQSGLLEKTQALGISDNTAVRAVMGSADARKQLADAINNQTDASKRNIGLDVARRILGESTALNESRLAQLKKNVAIAATKAEVQKAQAALDKFARTHANASVGLKGAKVVIRQLNAINSLMADLTHAKTPNAVAPPKGGLGVLLGAEGAGARGAIINRPTVALIGENGPERLTPLDQTPGNAPLPGGGGSAPMFNVEKVYAQDVNDFLRQLQTRSRLAGLDGVRR